MVVQAAVAGLPRRLGAEPEGQSGQLGRATGLLLGRPGRLPGQQRAPVEGGGGVGQAVGDGLERADGHAEGLALLDVLDPYFKGACRRGRPARWPSGPSTRSRPSKAATASAPSTQLPGRRWPDHMSASGSEPMVGHRACARPSSASAAGAPVEEEHVVGDGTGRHQAEPAPRPAAVRASVTSRRPPGPPEQPAGLGGRVRVGPSAPEQAGGRLCLEERRRAEMAPVLFGHQGQVQQRGSPAAGTLVDRHLQRRSPGDGATARGRAVRWRSAPAPARGANPWRRGHRRSRPAVAARPRDSGPPSRLLPIASPEVVSTRDCMWSGTEANRRRRHRSGQSGGHTTLVARPSQYRSRRAVL